MASNVSMSDLLPPPTDINDTHKVYSIAAACITLGIVASVFVLLRFFQRWRCGAFGADDYAMIPALLFYLGWTAMAAYVNLHAGVGKPLWEITVPEYSIWFQGLIGSAWLYPVMSASIRISILLFYRRVFANAVAHWKLVIKILLALQAIYVVVYSILPGFICRPLYMAWNPILRPLYMDNWYYYYVSVALYSTSMAFDIILLFLPLWPVMKLQMPMQKRVGVVAMFMLGAMASIVAAYKLAIFVTQMTRFDDINPKWADYQMSMLIPPQFDEYGVTFWIPSQIEPTVALIGTSLPALRLLLSGPEGTSTGRSRFTGKSSDKGMHSESRGSRTRQARPGLESQLPLRGEYGEYVELNDGKSLAK